MTNTITNEKQFWSNLELLCDTKETIIRKKIAIKLTNYIGICDDQELIDMYVNSPIIIDIMGVELQDYYKVISEVNAYNKQRIGTKIVLNKLGTKLGTLADNMVRSVNYNYNNKNTNTNKYCKEQAVPLKWHSLPSSGENHSKEERTNRRRKIDGGTQPTVPSWNHIIQTHNTSHFAVNDISLQIWDRGITPGKTRYVIKIISCNTSTKEKNIRYYEPTPQSKFRRRLNNNKSKTNKNKFIDDPWYQEINEYAIQNQTLVGLAQRKQLTKKKRNGGYIISDQDVIAVYQNNNAQHDIDKIELFFGRYKLVFDRFNSITTNNIKSADLFSHWYRKDNRL